MAVRPDRPALEPGWLFETVPSPRDLAGPGARLELPLRQALTIRPPLAELAPLVYRLWATQVERGESVLLEESRGPLTAPSWSPDGQALAFGRLVPEPDGRARFEVVVQEAPDRRRVLLARPAGEFNARAAELPGLAVVWSPDGRYLAAPLFQQSLTLAIVRADNGRILKEIKEAYLPAWSPDGSKLAFVQGSDAESLYYVDQSFGPARHLADIGQTSQAPVWFRDGRSLAVLTRQTETQFRRREPALQRIDLFQIHIESGKKDLLTTLVTEPLDSDRAYNGSSFSLDRDGNELFYVSDLEGQLTQITWFRPRTSETLEKFHPIDPIIRIGALAVSPSGKNLALRVGSPGDLSTPAVFDLTSRRFTPVIPDDEARIEWVATLVRTAQMLLRTHLPGTDAANRAIDRPTLLPVPGELPLNSEIPGRLRRIGKIGRPLCDRPAAAEPAGPGLLDVLAEARLFFDVLSEDYPAALASLEALEPRLANRDQRLRLLGVRAQLFLGQKQFDQAAKTIAFLQTIDAAPDQLFEETPLGPALTALEGPVRHWPSYLNERMSELLKESSAAENERPLGHRNPDNPNPNADIVPNPNFAPLPVAPMIQVAPPFLPLVPEFVRPVPPPPNRAGAPRPPLLPRAGRPAPGR
jgi:hypothetical protein